MTNSTIKVETTESDLDFLTVITMESLQSDKDVCMSKVTELSESIDRTYFEVAAYLVRIKDECWWKDDYVSWEDYCNSSGIGYRKAQYFINIYENLVEEGIEWDDIKEIGWSKLKEFAHLITTDNVSEWVSKASKMTVASIQAYVKQLKDQGVSKEDSSSSINDVEVVKNFSTKLKPDQWELVKEAVHEAQESLGTKDTSVALQHITSSWLESKQPGASNSVALHDMSYMQMVEAFRQTNPLHALEAFGDAWPSISIEVVAPDDIIKTYG